MRESQERWSLRTLKKLQDLFMAEAGKYDVLPLDDRFIERADPALRPSLIEGRTAFTYYAGTSRVAESCAPNTKNRSHTITVYVDMPADGGDGVLVAEGGVVGGFTLYVKNRKPVYEYNCFTADRYKVAGAEPLPFGPCIVRMEFEYDGGGLGKGGTVKLLVNGKQAATGRVDKTEFARFSGPAPPPKRHGTDPNLLDSRVASGCAASRSRGAGSARREPRRGLAPGCMAAFSRARGRERSRLP